MRRNFWLVGLLVLLLTAFAGPVAYAQSGDNDKFVLNEDFVLRADDVLSGRLIVVNGSATLEPGSTVRQDVAAFGSTLTIAGTVQGNLLSFGGSVHLTDTAVIDGDFAAFGGRVVRDQGATIHGDSIDTLRPRIPEEIVPPALPRARSFARELLDWQLGTIGAVLFLIALGIVAVLLAPRAVGRVASAAATEPALTFGLGLLTFIVAALAGTLLLIACGLGLLVWLALGLAFLLGWISVGLWVGQRLLAALRVRPVTALGQVAFGLLVITVLARLPFCIGFLFTVIIGSIGLGSVIVTRFGTQSAEERAAPAQPVAPPGADAPPLELPAPPSDEGAVG